jgi:hypothetical protein
MMLYDPLVAMGAITPPYLPLLLRVQRTSPWATKARRLVAWYA